MIRGLYHRGSRLGAEGKSDLDDAGAHDFVDHGRLYREKRQRVFFYGLEKWPEKQRQLGIARRRPDELGIGKMLYLSQYSIAVVASLA